MSSAKPSLPAATATEQPTPTLFRFSLLTLLSVMTLAGFTSAIVFSPHWDIEERLLLAFWCAGLILGVSIGRFRGTNGVIGGGLGAVVGSLFAATLLLNDKSNLMPELVNQEVTRYAAFVVGLSWIAATFAALGYRAVSTGQLERWWFSPRSRRVLITFVGCTAGLIITWQLFRERPWLPTWEIDLRNGYGGHQTFFLSPKGDYLLVHFHGGNDPTRILQLTSKGVITRELPEGVAEHNVAFSPDGTVIAAGTDFFCRLVDAKTGKTLRKVPVKGIEKILRLQFDATGEHFLMTTQTPRIQRLYQVEVADPTPPEPKRFPFTGALYLDLTGKLLIKVHEPVDETYDQWAEIVQLEDESVVGEIKHLRGSSPIFAVSGEHLVFGERVWKASGGEAVTAIRADPLDDVIGLPAGRRAIVLNYLSQHTRSEIIPEWLTTMPFIRHSLMESQGELQIVDIESGTVRAKSPAYVHHFDAKVSDDGKVVVAMSYDGYVRIWKVPEP